MTSEGKKRLLDVVNACDAIAEFVAGKDFLAYESDRLLRSAVERQFEIIGEALNKAATAEMALASELPEFHRIIGLRNRLIHGYDNVDDEILWDVVQSKLGPLRAHVDAILRVAPIQ
jgi:uncharacterized protein with HEPN domain